MAFRIASLYLLTTLGLLVILGAGVYFSTEQALLESRRRDLQAAAGSAAGLLQVAVNTQEELLALAPALAGNIAAPQQGGRTLRVFSANGALIAVVPEPENRQQARRPSSAAARLLPPTLITLAVNPVDLPGMIYAAEVIPGQDPGTREPRIIGVVELMQPRREIDAILEGLRAAFAGAGLAAVALALLAGILLARSVTAPVLRLNEVAAAIAAGELRRRAGPLPANEIGALGNSFNTMAARLAGLIDEAQAEQQRLRAILGSLADGVLACDVDGRLSLHNPAARQMLGLGGQADEQALAASLAAAGIDRLWRRAMGQEPPGTPPGPVEQELRIAGRSVLIVAAPVHATPPAGAGPNAQPARRSSAATGEDTTVPASTSLASSGTTAARHDSSNAPVTRHPSPVTRHSSPVTRHPSPVAGCVSVLRDVTRVRELEQAQTSLVRRLAHELRTPLTALVATVDNMRDTASADQQAAMSIVESEALRLNRLVDELLAISRGAGPQMNEARPLDLAQLAAGVCALFKRRAERLGVELVSPGGGRAVVRGDPDRLRQLLVNLLDNALRFVPAGGRIVVVVRVEGGAALLTVADDGAGMDAATARRALAPHRQGSAAVGSSAAESHPRDSRPPGDDLSAPRTAGEERPVEREEQTGAPGRGSGLGLAIVRDIAEAHGGRVTIDTAPGQGTTVSVHLPLADR